MKINKRLYLKFLLFGALLALPYIFSALWMLAYVAIVPMLFVLMTIAPEIGKKQAYMLGFCFGVGYFGVMFHWFTEFYPMEFAGVTPATAALLVAVCWIGLTALQAFEIGFVTLLYRVLAKKAESRLLCAFVFTALWVLFEWQQTFFFRGVPWARLAITQAKNPLVIQSASLFGGLFISGFIVFINALLTLAALSAYERLKSSGEAEKAKFPITGALKNKKTAIFASVALGLFLLNTVFGAVRLAVKDNESETKIEVAVIQGNISSLDKWGSSTMKSLEKYEELTRKCAKENKVRYVVWPETVVPAKINLYQTLQARLSALADELDIYLFVGAFDSSREKNSKGEYEEYNAIYLFTPDGQMSEERYYKRRLVPFGEYMPMEKIVLTLLPVLDTFNLFNDPLSPGKGSQLFTTEDGKIGSLICFDSIYDYLTSESVADGAGLITLSTNDSWFTDSPAVYQHNRHAAIRAVESGRYIVRAASTGVSSVYSPTGEVLAEIPPLTERYATAEVYMTEGRTVYGYIGNIFVYICLLFVFAHASFNVTIYLKHKKLR